MRLDDVDDLGVLRGDDVFLRHVERCFRSGGADAADATRFGARGVVSVVPASRDVAVHCVEMVAQKIHPKRVVQLTLHVNGQLLKVQVVLLGFGENILEAGLIVADDSQRFHDDMVCGKHTIFVRFQHVCFQKDAWAIAGCGVGLGEHGGEAFVVERRGGIAPRMKLDIARDGDVQFAHRRPDFRLPNAA